MRGVFSKGRPLASPVSWTGIYGFFLLTVFILWVPSSGYQNIVWPKHLLFLWATALFVLGLVPMVLIQKARQSLPERWTGADRLPLCLAAGLLLLFLLSALASPYPDVVWLGNRRYEGFLTLALYLVIFISAALWGRLGPLHVAGTALSALLVSALVLAQFLGKNPLGLYPPGLGFHDRGLKYSGEYLGTIGNSDLLSAYLTMACLYLWGAYAVSRSRVRLLYLSAGLAAWFALLLSEVAAGPAAVLGCLIICLPLCLAKGLGIRRMGEIFASLALGGLWKSVLGYEYQAGALTVFFSWGAEAWLLLAGVLLGLAATLLLRRLPEGRRLPKTALALTLAFLLLILAVLGFLYGYSGQQTSLQDLSQLLHGNLPPTLGSSRIAIWQEALELGLERPALGSGPDTYQLRSSLIFTRELPGGQMRRTSVDAAHCEYLNLWVNTGLASMLLFLGLLAAVLLPAARRLRPALLPLLLPALGYAIHALFGISQSLVSPLFYLFLGTLARASRRAKSHMSPDQAA